jgi:hypothetical protein
MHVLSPRVRRASALAVVTAAVALAGFAAAPYVAPRVTAVAEPTSQPTTTATFDPKALAILDRFIEVTGGKAAYAKVTSRQVKAKVEFVGQNVNGDVTIKELAPNKILIVTTLPGLGVIEQCYNGEVAWERSPLTGLRVLEGKERDQLVSQVVDDLSAADPQKAYTSATYIGEDVLDGKPVDKIATDGLSGKATQYFAKDTGLLVSTQSIYVTPQGEIPVVTKTDEYVEFAGLKYPKVSTASMGPAGSLKTTLVEVTANPDLPADTFKAPDDVKALTKK